MPRIVVIIAFLVVWIFRSEAQPVNTPAFQPIQCTSSVIYDAATNGATELIPLVTGRSVYICGYTLWSGGTAAVDIRYGTGTACATGGVKMTPSFALTAQTGVWDSSPVVRGLITPASQAVCIFTSAGVAVQAIVHYSQF